MSTGGLRAAAPLAIVTASSAAATVLAYRVGVPPTAGSRVDRRLLDRVAFLLYAALVASAAAAGGRRSGR